jgi:hypothetical protein
MNTIGPFLASFIALGAAAGTARADDPPATTIDFGWELSGDPRPPRGAAITPVERTLDRALPPGPMTPASSPPATVTIPEPTLPIPPLPAIPSPAMPPATPAPASLPAPSIPAIPSTAMPTVSIPTVPALNF